ncbi:long-chain fatty acid--CoA ligase [Sphingomonas ginkgonis]|uniref:3-methylmercaptopropionyl-CoA ligase n=1 Tax=Sphingomonas ginkgonis TaxID=2315330 RepID=A0A429VB34_9SPHN|nr:class I adenylate-forming enzyme family protein [Sphingomonas ginkgonis]RST31134.1 long-chain fatty acid--CoA ligase [Sphingomonas ginkgonis]
MTASRPLAVPDAWPACSLEDASALLCAPGAKFEIDTLSIRGIPTRVWKQALPSLAALVAVGRSHGPAEFLVYEDERATFDEWHRAVAALAGALRARGVGKGDRVALAMRNLPEWPVAFFAVTILGAICVPLNAWWTGPELAYGLSDSGASVLIADAERLARILPHRDDLPAWRHMIASRVEEARPAGVERLEALIGATADWGQLPDAELPVADLSPDDHATIFYTSGTTGQPKGALGTHRNLITNIYSASFAAARAALRRGEAPPEPEPKTILLAIPLFHVTACSATLMGAVAAGHKLVFMHRWDTLRALALIEREKVNATGGVPTIAWQLIEHPERERFDLSSLELISYGGAPSAPELVRKVHELFGALPGNGWGMTETMATVTSHSAEDYLNRPDSCGPPVPVADLRIMDPDGERELPVGAVGELWARGPMVVAGYWGKPDATAATFVDGWVRTGDLARLDPEGFCFIVDRAKDMVIRGGENIYSSEVENALYEHPAVTDAAVIGRPHRTLGEEPVAVVHLAPGAEAGEEELRAFVRDRLAAFKVPVRILFLDDHLPRNANGKILKKDLAPLFAAT